MNELTVSENDFVKKMTSLEIAELVESRHDKVKQSIERLAKREVVELPPMGEVKNHLGQMVQVYSLDKRSSLIVVAQLSPEFTARVVDRWQELESQQLATTRALPQNYKEALLQLVEQVEQNEQLQLTIYEQAPKVAALDRISTADGFLCITDTAKFLQLRPKDIFSYMSANGWIYRRAGGKSWIAYQDRIKQGVLSHKITTVQRSDGSEKTVEQVLVTPKGLSVLAEKFAIAWA